MRIFDSVARSILCYGAQIWGFQKWDVVEKLLRFFVKKLLRLPYNTPNYMILLESGCDPIFVYTLKLHWAFMMHTWAQPDDRYSKLMMRQGILKKHRWFKYILQEANKCGIVEQFDNFDNVELRVPLEILFNYVISSERQGILDKVVLGQFHPLYKEYKCNWGREAYFSDNLTLREIRYILMARTEMLPLNWKPWFPDNDYQCFLCNMRVNENTEHFIKQCPILKEFRPRTYVTANINNILMGELGWKELANFICVALNYRTILVAEFNG